MLPQRVRAIKEKGTKPCTCGAAALPPLVRLRCRPGALIGSSAPSRHGPG